MDKRFIIAILVSVAALSVLSVMLYRTPVQTAGSAEDIEKIVEDCVYLCAQASYEINLSNGPCLSDLYPDKWNHPGWVCDVAHWPRKDVDNLPENQCKEFREGKADKFVEVDPNCKPIRVYTPQTGEILLVE